jgi:predicted deacetylase
MRKLTAFIVVSAVLSCFFLSGLILYITRPFDPEITVYPWPYGKEGVFTITCDDISTGYPLEYFTDIVALLEDHGLKATFFVIPYHGEWDLLTDSPEFLEALHDAEEHGHEIALHGYAHYENEFLCSPEEQETLLVKGLEIMYKAGFSVKGFRAPCLQETRDTPTILEKYGFLYDTSYFGESGEIRAGSIFQMPSGHEYTWYISEEETADSVLLAQGEFLKNYAQGSVFSFVTHMKAVNEGGGMEVLDQLFSFISTFDVWNGTLLELVQWEKARGAVTWDQQKTISGGEILFSNIPEGLTMEIVLPDSFHMEDIPPGIRVIPLQDMDTYRIIFEEAFQSVTLGFTRLHGSRTPELVQEVAIISDAPDIAGGSPADLIESLEAWEIPYRIIPVDSLLEEEKLGKSSTLFLDTLFLHRSLTEEEIIHLFSLEGRIIVLSRLEFSPIHEAFLEKREEEELEYIARPLVCGKIKQGKRDFVYFDVRVVSGVSTCVIIDQLREDSPAGLYQNLLIRALFSLSRIPTRTPFLSLEIDDCGMYDTQNDQGASFTADIHAYENSMDLAGKHGLKPLYGFTTSYFEHNPQIESIFSLLKKSGVQIANHGFHHCLNYDDPDGMREEISRANEDIQSLWGQPPRIILVPCDKMHQDSMKEAIRGTPIQYVGSTDNGYEFGVCEGVLFYERTSLQLCSSSVDDAPPFRRLFLYSQPLLPSFYAITHIFNFIDKGSAYHYIEDAVFYLTDIGYWCSDTETMTDEDVFWYHVDMHTHTRGNTVVVELDGIENLPQFPHTVHISVYGSPLVEVHSEGFSIELQVQNDGLITYVTLIVQPEMLPHR